MTGRESLSASRPATRSWRALEALAEEFGGVQIARGAGGAGSRYFWFVRVSTSSGEYAAQAQDIGDAVQLLAEHSEEWSRG